MDQDIICHCNAPSDVAAVMTGDPNVKAAMRASPCPAHLERVPGPAKSVFQTGNSGRRD
jgi:hypothetical protein